MSLNPIARVSILTDLIRANENAILFIQKTRGNYPHARPEDLALLAQKSANLARRIANTQQEIASIRLTQTQKQYRAAQDLRRRLQESGDAEFIESETGELTYPGEK